MRTRVKVFVDPLMLCADTVNCTAEVLAKLGFTIHPVMSVLIPSTVLGQYRFCAVSLFLKICLWLTDSKKKHLQNICEEAPCLQEIQIRHLARLIGHLVVALSGVKFGNVFVKSLEIIIYMDVCVCVRERERESVCVCVREREREIMFLIITFVGCAFLSHLCAGMLLAG